MCAWLLGIFWTCIDNWSLLHAILTQSDIELETPSHIVFHTCRNIEREAFMQQCVTELRESNKGNFTAIIDRGNDQCVQYRCDR